RCGLPAPRRPAGARLASGVRAWAVAASSPFVGGTIATEQREKGTTWSISFREAVCGTMKTAAVGAQTERPGAAGAGEGVAWRLHLTGRFVYLFPSRSFAARCGPVSGPDHPLRPKVSRRFRRGDPRSAAVAGSGETPAATSFVPVYFDSGFVFA